MCTKLLDIAEGWNRGGLLNVHEYCKLISGKGLLNFDRVLCSDKIENVSIVNDPITVFNWLLFRQSSEFAHRIFLIFLILILVKMTTYERITGCNDYIQDNYWF